MNKAKLLCASAFVLVVSGNYSYAQEVVMRRPLPSDEQLVADWRTSTWQNVDSSGNPIENACGNVRQLRDVWCESDGARVDASVCNGLPPANEQYVWDDSGCAYDWQTDQWLDPGANCTADEVQTRSVVCIRTADNTIVSDTNCSAQKPEAVRQVPDYSACSYSWQTTGWQDPGENCTQSEVQTRNVSCKRDLDNAVVADANCDAGTKPANTQTVPDLSNCSYSWASAEWVDPGNACTSAETQTRSVTCQRDLDKAVVSDSNCDAGSKPNASQDVADWSSCSYSAVNWSPETWAQGCSATATWTKTAKCQRSDGTIVADSECTSREISLTETGQGEHYENCAHSWKTDATWTDPTQSCTSAETQTRAVWCQRDIDQAVAADANCDAANKPSTTQSIPDYSGCTYTAVNWSGQNWNSTCSNTATWTKTAQCQRSDGAIVDAANCENHGVALTQTGQGSNLTNCNYSWATDATWTDPGASCTSSEIQTRAVWCKRDVDGTVVADSNCTSAKPSTIQTVADYSGCSFTAVNWSNKTYSSTCSANATWTKTAQCQRSDGTLVASSNCTNNGVSLTQTGTEANYTSCTNSWSAGSWTDPGANCTASEVQTRSVTCKRDIDGTVLADANCNASNKPVTTQSVSDYSGCSYTAVNWSGKTYSSTCSANATWTRTAQCQRADGTIVADTNCTSRGIALTQTGSEANYASCTYAWATDASWTNPTASCTSSETQTRAVWCKRELDGLAVADSNCNASTKPASSQTTSDYTGCSYTAVNWGTKTYSSTCSANATWTQTAQCQRSDGTIIADSNCSSRSIALTQSGTEANYTSCTNSWSAGSWTDPGASCTASELQTRSVTCKRDLDGKVMADANCNAGTKPSTTQTVADYSGCTYVAVNWGSKTYSSTCSANATWTRTATCQRSDGTPAASSYCTNSGVALTESGTEANYTSCANSWSAGSWTDPGASCTASELQTRSVTCKRDLDGTVMADANCNASTKPTSTQTVADYSGCTYVAVNWGNKTYDSTCSATANWTRTATCQRSDGTAVASSYCTGSGVSLTQTGTEANYSSCTYTWANDPTWTNPSASCTASETQTRAVWCKRTLDNLAVADTNCNASTKPAATQTTSDYSGCTYSAVNWSGKTYDSTCSANANWTKTAQCQRSDGTIVANTECTSRNIALTQTGTEANYASCTNSWSAGSWTDPGASCTASELQTRSVTCKRDVDGLVLADANCNASTKPASSQTVSDYSGCTYLAVNWSGKTYSSTCSATATWTKTASCQRSDGTAVAASYCTSAGIALTQTGTEANYTSCTNSWSTGSWTDPGASCTASELQTRSVTCKRDVDGLVLADSNCDAGTKPASSRTGADYSGCTYTAVNWTGQIWSSTCSANATWTNTAQCRRSDGTIVSNSECTNRGIAVSSSGSGSNYSSCSYTWTTGSYVDPGASCTSSEIQTRAVTCTRTVDGATVADSFCTTTKPGTTQTVSDYSGCTYSAVNWSSASWTSMCSASSTWTQTAQCQRSDGTVVPNTECTSRGIPLTQSGTTSNYTGCTYSWQTGNWSNWSNCTSGTQSQTRSVVCQRQDGTAVADSFCTTTKPATTQSQSCQATYNWKCIGFFNGTNPGGTSGPLSLSCKNLTEPDDGSYRYSLYITSSWPFSKPVTDLGSPYTPPTTNPWTYNGSVYSGTRPTYCVARTETVTDWFGFTSVNNYYSCQ